MMCGSFIGDDPSLYRPTYLNGIIWISMIQREGRKNDGQRGPWVNPWNIQQNGGFYEEVAPEQSVRFMGMLEIFSVGWGPDLLGSNGTLRLRKDTSTMGFSLEYQRPNLGFGAFREIGGCEVKTSMFSRVGVGVFSTWAFCTPCFIRGSWNCSSE